MASNMKKGKTNWPLIALIAFCSCVIIAAAVLCVINFLSSDKPEEKGGKEPSNETVQTEPEPDDEPENSEDMNYPVTAPSGALSALDTPVEGEPYNILLMGVDMGGGLTDVIMIYQIDPENGKINLLSVPRDTKITLNGRTEKINAAHYSGQKLKDPEGGDRADEYAINAIRSLTGIPIHHYMCINTSSFRGIIDILDGFDFEVPRNMDYDDSYQGLHIHLQKGMQHLDGDKAEQLVRFRKYPNGDIDRIKIQQQVLLALIDQKVNSAYIAKLSEIFKTIRGNAVTDLTPISAAPIAADILSICKDGSENVSTYTLPGSFSDIGGISYWAPSAGQISSMAKNTFGY